ncbi:unnamed protein product [Closterium sp. Yama58-4]|nr:unnamed protein product [Closterium sp. Yama58-4]
MPRFNRREQLPLHIKRALCAHHVEHPLLRHVDLARWVYAQYGLRPDRSTVGRILKNAERWALTEPTAANQVRRRGGAWPKLEQAMARWIANAGPAGVPLTLQTIRDHVATMARNMGIPPVFRCSIGWVRRALRRQGVRCRAATGEAASADMAAVREAREKVPQLLTHLGYKPRDTFNLDETALWLSVLPRKTYSNARIPGRKVSKDRKTVAFLVNADGSHVFQPLVISKARRPHDFRPDYDPKAVCYWRHNAKGWMTSAVYSPPLYLPPSQSPPTVVHAFYVAAQCRDVCRRAAHRGAARQRQLPYAAGRVRVERNRLRHEDHVPQQRAHHLPAAEHNRLHAAPRPGHNRDREGPLPPALAAGLHGIVERRRSHKRRRPLSPQSARRAGVALRRLDECRCAHHLELDDDIDDVGELIGGLGLGTGAMTAAEYVAIDEGEPTCAEPVAEPTRNDADVGLVAELWRAPTTMQAVYDDSDPVGREARRTARAACEMLIGYARAVSVTPRDLCHLFDIRNPIIRERMERASPALNLRQTPRVRGAECCLAG